MNHRTQFGESALLATILNETATPTLVRTLIDAGIDIHAANVDGVTPLSAARAAGRQDVAAILDE